MHANLNFQEEDVCHSIMFTSINKNIIYENVNKNKIKNKNNKNININTYESINKNITYKKNVLQYLSFCFSFHILSYSIILFCFFFFFD